MRIGMVKFKRCALVTLLAPLLLTACTSGDHLDDLRAYTAEVKARKHGRVEPLPEIKPHETFLYQAYDLRDPLLRLHSARLQPSRQRPPPASGLT